MAPHAPVLSATMTVCRSCCRHCGASRKLLPGAVRLLQSRVQQHGCEAGTPQAAADALCDASREDQRHRCVLLLQWAAVFEGWDCRGATPLLLFYSLSAHALRRIALGAAEGIKAWLLYDATGSFARSSDATGITRLVQKAPKALAASLKQALHGMKALEGALMRRGQLLSVLIPSRYCCNNPGCGNMAGPSESFHLVRGRSCICGGCVGQQQRDAGMGHALAAR